MYSSVTPSQRVVLSTSILLKYFTATLNSNSRKKQKNDANNFSVSASSSNLLSQDVVSPQSFIAFEQHIIHATQAWRGCSRIIDSPMPFSYGHLFHLMLFVTFVLASSLGGVPVLSLPILKSYFSSCSLNPVEGFSSNLPAGVLLSPI